MQALFARAVIDHNAQIPAITNAANGRFNIYRNNYLITLGNALRTTYPAIERLVGAEFFAALTSAFVGRHPPRSPIMARYGDEFPGFLGRFPALEEFPYLADVGRLEYARVRAYHAADVARFVFDGETAATAAMDGPATLHPSVDIINSAYPIYSIWQAQFGDGQPAEPDWLPETVLVWRHGASETAEAMRIDGRERDLLMHLESGGSLAELLSDCADEQAATFLITKFLEMAAAGILVPNSPIEHGDNS